MEAVSLLKTHRKSSLNFSISKRSYKRNQFWLTIRSGKSWSRKLNELKKRKKCLRKKSHKKSPLEMHSVQNCLPKTPKIQSQTFPYHLKSVKWLAQQARVCTVTSSKPSEATFTRWSFKLRSRGKSELALKLLKKQSSIRRREARLTLCLYQVANLGRHTRLTQMGSIFRQRILAGHFLFRKLASEVTACAPRSTATTTCRLAL